MRLRPARTSLLRLLPGVLALLACNSKDTSVAPVPVQAPVWSEVTNLVPATTLYGLWAPRADYVVGVGSKGQIWEWNGQRWSRHVNADGHDLFAIDGDTQGGVIAVGSEGTVLEQVNGFFVPRDAGVRDNLHDVWRSPAGEFIVVGDGGDIARGDGTTWSLDASGIHSPLLSVWGSGADNVFAVGVDGVILHYDGAAWTSMASATTQLLAAVEGTGADDVYAVGAAGTILHYDGAMWAPLTSATADLLQTCCAACGPAAAGVNGTVMTWSNGTIHHATLEGAPWLYAMAHAGTDTWAVGAHALYRQSGEGWTSETTGTIPVLRAITSSPSIGLIAVGDDGAVMRGGMQHWSYEDAGALQRLNAVWASPAGDVFAAGTNRIYRRANGSWVVENSDIAEFFDIGGDDAHVFAVGSHGAIRERRGTGWASVFGEPGYDLHAVSMNDDEDYIVGTDGSIFYYENGSWVLEYTRPGVTLWDIAKVQSPLYRAVAVGSNGVSLGRSSAGLGWSTMQTPVTTTLYSLARGPDGYLYAVGSGGTVLRLLDDKWSLVAAPTTRTFRKAWLRDGALFLCGGSDPAGGMIFRYGPPGP